MSKMFYAGPLNISPQNKRAVRFERWNIVRGDTVKVLAGNDKGKVSTVLKVYRKTNQVIVKDVSLKTEYSSNPYK
jgi:hypothetical protein